MSNKSDQFMGTIDKLYVQQIESGELSINLVSLIKQLEYQKCVCLALTEALMKNLNMSDIEYQHYLDQALDTGMLNWSRSDKYLN